PDAHRRAAEEAALSLEALAERAAELGEQVAGWPGNRNNRMQLKRLEGLAQRLTALSTRVAINQGKEHPFDEESQLLFGVTAPDHDAAHFEDILQEIDALLPGTGGLSAR